MISISKQKQSIGTKARNPRHSTSSKVQGPKSSISSKKPSTNANAPWVYSDTVKEHFLNPRNFLMGDESAYPHDGQGIVGNPICGDQMLMMIQVDPATDTIRDVKWKTYGCASAIASTSALSELAKGRTLDQAANITAEEIAEYLGGLPQHKFHCSVLGHQALAAAIQDYRAHATVKAAK